MLAKKTANTWMNCPTFSNSEDDNLNVRIVSYSTAQSSIDSRILKPTDINGLM